MASTSLPTVAELEQFIGRRVRYLGHRWQIIEVLDEELSLVLQADDDSERIMSNSHGEPVRSLPEIMTLKVKDPEGEGLNPELGQLDVLSAPSEPD
ncbi:hypothetical protein [Natronospira bacteriovora]|uniref:Uncharacterized protein n=1 Tax=Natronospira bacteriovora TaxID=3069753 RepID=A0ABU0W2L5_9GAMM|nr:hypothetical protein [Natronospira sp. AB-CW4]MDQ2068254.1 hypothetical protein [Natronospira sp. AB-CW4]